MTDLHMGADYEQNDIGADPKRWTKAMLGDTATLAGLAPLRHGTAEGRAVVMMVIELPNGEQVIAQTTLRLWRMANAYIEAGPIAAEEAE